jgi:transcriptional regulator with XRE-family HTH domain
VLGDLVHKYEAEHDPMAAVSDTDMVRFLLESNEMTRTELVQHSGIAESTVSEILVGKRKLSRRHIALLSRVFRVSPAVFFPEAVEMTPERVARIISRRGGLELGVTYWFLSPAPSHATQIVPAGVPSKNWSLATASECLPI